MLLGENDASRAIDCDADVCADPPQLFRIARIASHRDYNRPPFRNDVAVVRLIGVARITEWVSPVCLPFAEQLLLPLIGRAAEVAGWGLLDIDDRVGSAALQTLVVPVVPLASCRQIYGDAIPIADGEEQLCAGGRTGEDSCGGDSGGPLVMAAASRALHGPRFFQFGVISVGSKRCGLTPTPAVYTNVRFYLGWILDQMDDDTG